MGAYVSDVAADPPLKAIAELPGVPQEDRRKVFDWSNQMIGYDDPEYTADPAVAAAEIIGYSMAMAEDRRRCPPDDIVTRLGPAQDGGGSLSPGPVGVLLVLACRAGHS